MPTSSWTDARVEILSQLWREGQSASAIARTLGGVTRNAVIGKAHRLGLGGRARPARPGSRPAGPPAKRERRVSRRRLAPTATPAPAELPQAQGLTDMASVGPHACRWPIGDPKAPGFALCGRPVRRGAYCLHHGALAYRATPRDHLLKLAGLA